jgi:hypothetical protein
MRRPTASEFWSFAQRYLAFEDPTDWWSRLLELTARQSNQSSKSVAGLPLGKQVDLLSAMYGAQDSDVSLASFNTVLGLEMLRRWQPQGLDVWALPFAKEMAQTDPRGSMSPAQSAWISSIERINLDWRRLLEDEGARTDSRSSVIISVIGDIESAGSSRTSQDSCDQLQRRFRTEVQRRRQELANGFFPNILMLVEGPTEVLLLPHYGARCNLDFNQHGVNVVPAGGANQVLRKYLEARETFAIPIVAVLDADAEEQAEMLYESLRPEDRMFIFSSGEIEDAIDVPSMLSTINLYLMNKGLNFQMQLGDLNHRGRRTAVLNRWWRQKGLGDFDKIGLAQTLTSRDPKDSTVPPEIKALIDLVKTVAPRDNG